MTIGDLSSNQLTLDVVLHCSTIIIGKQEKEEKNLNEQKKFFLNSNQLY